MIKIYDSDHNFLKIIDKDYKDLYHTKELDTGFQTLNFKLPCKEEYLLIMDEENYVEEEQYNYIIKEIISDSNDFISVYCGPDIEDIQGSIFMIFDFFDGNLEQAYNYCLSNTDWTVSYNSENKSIVSYQEPNVNAYEMINKIAKDYNQERWFDTKNKILYIYDTIGNNDGNIYYSNELKIKNLSKQSQTYDYATVLYPIGKDGLTISSINNGKPYLENFSYTNKYIEKIWINEDYDIPEELMKAGERYLNDISAPKASYKLKLSDLGYNINIGDVIFIVDKIKHVKQQQRVVKIVEYPDAPEKSSVDLSNIQVDFAKTFIKGQRKMEQDIAYIKKVIKNLK